MPLQLAPAIILVGYYPSTSTGSFMLSDHSRSPLSISNNRYEKSVQLANGLTRKYVISNKREVSMSWEMLPSSASATVDGGAGAYDLQKFYNNNFDNTITVTTFIDGGSGTPAATGLTLKNSYPEIQTMPSVAGTSWTAYIEDFSCEVQKRYRGGGTVGSGLYDLWNVSISLAEA